MRLFRRFHRRAGRSCAIPHAPWQLRVAADERAVGGFGVGGLGGFASVLGNATKRQVTNALLLTAPAPLIFIYQFLLYDYFKSLLGVSPSDLSEGLDVFADRLSFYD